MLCANGLQHLKSEQTVRYVVNCARRAICPALLG